MPPVIASSAQRNAAIRPLKANEFILYQSPFKRKKAPQLRSCGAFRIFLVS